MGSLIPGEGEISSWPKLALAYLFMGGSTDQRSHFLQNYFRSCHNYRYWAFTFV